MIVNISELSWRIFLLGVLAAVSLTSRAADDSGIKLFLGAGIELGGDSLVEEAGGYGSYDINANSGVGFSAGALIDLEGETFDGELLISVGRLENSGDSEFSVDHLDLIYLFTSPDSPHILGAGLVYHASPKFDLEDDPGCKFFDCAGSDFPEGTTKFDDAIGLTLRYEIELVEYLRAGISYTLIEYESDVKNVNGDSLGLFFYVPFGL
jgi:hypothetical protein